MMADPNTELVNTLLEGFNAIAVALMKRDPRIHRGIVAAALVNATSNLFISIIQDAEPEDATDLRNQCLQSLAFASTAVAGTHVEGETQETVH